MITAQITEEKLYRAAFWLAIFTIFYNIAEGAISTYLGFTDEALTLFGFGADSFIETISGIGIASMIIRIQKHPNSTRDKFEITALKITGWSFYLLVLILIVMAAYNIYAGQKPETTLWGVVISVISIIIMWILIRGKLHVGRKLNSQPIIADANCTMVCMYMSVILLISSTVYYFFRLPYIDVIGALGLAYFSFKEGRECFEKAQNKECSDCAHD